MQIGMKLLQLLNGGEVTVQRPRVRNTADAGKVDVLIIGVCISNSASGSRSCGHIRECVKQMSKFVRYSILLYVSDVITSVIDTPLFEIPSQDLALAALRG